MIRRTFILIIILILPTFFQHECFGTTRYVDYSNLWRFTMADSKDTLISAQVLLRPASGKAIDSNVMITADNLADYAPSPDTVSSASEIFLANGFKVGPMVGVSFSITGTIKTFEKFFGTQVQMGKDGANEFVVNGEVIGKELSGRNLPNELHSLVAIVAFPEPVEPF